MLSLLLLLSLHDAAAIPPDEVTYRGPYSDLLHYKFGVTTEDASTYSSQSTRVTRDGSDIGVYLESDQRMPGYSICFLWEANGIYKVECRPVFDGRPHQIPLMSDAEASRISSFTLFWVEVSKNINCSLIGSFSDIAPIFYGDMIYAASARISIDPPVGGKSSTNTAAAGESGYCDQHPVLCATAVIAPIIYMSLNDDDDSSSGPSSSPETSSSDRSSLSTPVSSAGLSIPWDGTYDIVSTREELDGDILYVVRCGWLPMDEKVRYYSGRYHEGLSTYSSLHNAAIAACGRQAEVYK